MFHDSLPTDTLNSYQVNTIIFTLLFFFAMAHILYTHCYYTNSYRGYKLAYIQTNIVLIDFSSSRRQRTHLEMILRLDRGVLESDEVFLDHGVLVRG